MRKILLLNFFICLLFGIDGKVVFYDGTTVEGSINSVDTFSVFLTPIGLSLPEEILVDNIDTLKLNNGIVMVVASEVKQIYQKGEFITLSSDPSDSYNESEYYDEYEEEEEKSNLEYFSFSAFGGYPIYLRPSLQGSKSFPNLGLGAQSPYFEVGPINAAPSAKIMTFGFTEGDMGPLKAIQLSGGLNIDLSPILYFLPDNLYLGGEGGLSYQLGWDVDYAGGLGIFVGGTMDYWFEELPLAFRLYGNGHLIPQPIAGLKTGFGTIGASFVLVLKRNNDE